MCTVLDETFPEITIDLVSGLPYRVFPSPADKLLKILVDGTFEPASVAALSHRLGIPQPLMFMTCPSAQCPHSIADFGTRIISL